MSAPRKKFIKYQVQGYRPFIVTDDYNIDYLLGVGAFGVVCAATHKESNVEVAIKQVTLDGRVTSAVRLLREVKLLSFFSHDCIVNLVDIVELPSKSFSELYMVIDKMDSDLDMVIQSQSLSPDHIQHFMYHLLRGVLYIHSAGVIHRDLKPRNILVTKDCDLKICDFGLAREMSEDGGHSVYVETRWYRAPEIIMGWEKYDQAVDMWSVGCIFAEMLLSRVLWPGKDSKNQLDMILRTLGGPTPEDVEGIGTSQAQAYVLEVAKKGRAPEFPHLFGNREPVEQSLLEGFLRFDPRKRLTAKQALRHEYFDDFEREEEPESELTFDLDLDSAINDRLDDLASVKEMLYNVMLTFHPEAAEQRQPTTTEESATTLSLSSEGSTAAKTPGQAPGSAMPTELSVAKSLTEMLLEDKPA